MNAWFVPSFAVFCFSHKNKSELTKWLTGAGARVSLGFGGMPPFPAVVLPFWQNLTLSLCRFGFLICQASITIPRCGEGMHSVDSCMCSCVEAEKWQKFHHAIMCLCILSPESILHFLSCPLQSLCFISSLPMENSAVFHTRLLQALQNPSLPCKGSAAFQWGFKQLHQLFVSHHKTPFSLLKASLKHFMCLHFQSPDLMEKEGGKALL